MLRKPEAPCGCDGLPVRPLYPTGKGMGKNSRRQHPTWYVCDRGHKQRRKRK